MLKELESTVRSMDVEVTIRLPESLVEHAKRLGSATNQQAEAIIADALGMMWLTLDTLPGNNPDPISSLTDEAVLALADSKMDVAQNQRLAELQERGKTAGLTEAERYEVFSLLQIYQIGQLRKSEALAEVVQRGLRNPLPA